MRATAWRPTANLRRRKSKYLSLLDASGVAAVFFFLLGLYLVTTPPFHTHSGLVDLAPVAHAKPQKGALREDAIIVTVARDGSVFCCGTKVLPQDLPELIRDAYKNGAERKVYVKADARAKYSDVKAVLDPIRSAGIQDVVFLVE